DPINVYCGHYGNRIHTVFNQAVTATGRLSSAEPNLQNIPIKSEYGREFRKAFIPEDGKIFISADYSQIDLRVLAHLSRDKKLVEAFKEGADIHSATAREVFGVPQNEELAPSLRSAAKAINFGIVYGISPFGLSKQLNIPVSKAKEYIDNYLDRYSGVKKWMNDVIVEARNNGYAKTLAGRKRYISELASTNKMIVQAGERMALNTPVQGASAEIIKKAMINIYSKLQKEKYQTKMLLQVHDDLLFETPLDEVDEIVAMVGTLMEKAVKLDIPLRVDIKSGKNWSDMEKIK
ncbi:MAG: DNA polymerase I, partial [Elusimicrobiota bacterium]|nr:DNA polymerase I [Elusimicrobiota bacterium]